MHVLVTGGAGSLVLRFADIIGSNGCQVLNVDKLTYAGTLTSLRSVSDNPRYRFVKLDICDEELHQ